MTHDKGCFMAEPWDATNNPFLCICDRLRKAYREGYSDHARTVQHWQDTHGAYRQHGVVIHQCPPDGVYLMPCCNISPLERLSDRMSMDPAHVTCTGRRS